MVKILLYRLDAGDQEAGRSHVWREVGDGGAAGGSRGRGVWAGGRSRGPPPGSSERGRGAASGSRGRPPCVRTCWPGGQRGHQWSVITRRVLPGARRPTAPCPGYRRPRHTAGGKDKGNQLWKMNVGVKSKSQMSENWPEGAHVGGRRRAQVIQEWRQGTATATLKKRTGQFWIAFFKWWILCMKTSWSSLNMC